MDAVPESVFTAERRLGNQFMAQVDKISFPNGIKTITNREFVHFTLNHDAIGSHLS
jgi:hypothetical protein